MTRVGRWCVETEKDVRLYIVNVTPEGRVEMSYGPGKPIAVSASREDFRRFFQMVKDGHKH